MHISIENQYPVVISLLLSHPGLDLTLRDTQGHTPFATAMVAKDNKAAQAILSREPRAAEQVRRVFQVYRIIVFLTNLFLESTAVSLLVCSSRSSGLNQMTSLVVV